ncbi:MAG: acyl-CoA carboxylase biotin carboxyl carrier protein subunit [Planctomycetota bacterium]|jgi:biotin carboxyl carrier protein
MKYFLRVDSGREFELEVENCADGHCQVRLDGREVSADFLDVDRLGQYTAILDGRSFAASIEEQDQQHLRVNIAGESYTVVAMDEREKAAGDVAGQGPPKAEVVKASMPGVIIAVSVEVGSTIEAEQPVAILEAMKMQNEVACQHGGVVAEVLVSVGESVDANQPLVRLAPPEEE